MVKMPNLFKKMSVLEILLLIVFIFYLIFNVQTPSFLIDIINSPVGIVVTLLLALSIFIYLNPVLGVVGLFVAFELIRRSNVLKPVGQVSMIQYTPKQVQKDEDMVKMNPTISTTLEEDVVNQMAPLGVSEPAGYVTSSFRPVSEDVHNASSI